MSSCSDRDPKGRRSKVRGGVVEVLIQHSLMKLASVCERSSSRSALFCQCWHWSCYTSYWHYESFLHSGRRNMTAQVYFFLLHHKCKLARNTLSQARPIAWHTKVKESFDLTLHKSKICILLRGKSAKNDYNCSRRSTLVKKLCLLCPL